MLSLQKKSSVLMLSRLTGRRRLQLFIASVPNVLYFVFEAVISTSPYPTVTAAQAQGTSTSGTKVGTYVPIIQPPSVLLPPEPRRNLLHLPLADTADAHSPRATAAKKAPPIESSSSAYRT
jgi:hypothetical protein